MPDPVSRHQEIDVLSRRTAPPVCQIIVWDRDDSAKSDVVVQALDAARTREGGMLMGISREGAEQSGGAQNAVIPVVWGVATLP